MNPSIGDPPTMKMDGRIVGISLSMAPTVKTEKDKTNLVSRALVSYSKNFVTMVIVHSPFVIAINPSVFFLFVPSFILTLHLIHFNKITLYIYVKFLQIIYHQVVHSTLHFNPCRYLISFIFPQMENTSAKKKMDLHVYAIKVKPFQIYTDVLLNLL